MLAVIDVETTGLNPARHDRILELAIVLIDSKGNVAREFDSLVNPERDVGPTRIHGLRARDILNAPTFEELLPEIFQALKGSTALVAHNLRFDLEFWEVELNRAGYFLPSLNTLCTMSLSGGGSLSQVCSQLGIESDGPAHTALADAKNTSKLLTSILSDDSHLAQSLEGLEIIQWPCLPVGQLKAYPRRTSASKSESKPTYLQRLISRADPEPNLVCEGPAMLAYSTLLSQALEDRRIDEAEAQALSELSVRWSISPQQISSIHKEFLLRLTVAALQDGVVTEVERNDIHQVAALLGVDTTGIDQSLDETLGLLASVVKVPTRAHLGPVVNLEQRTVCFTGELCSCIGGVPISREMAEQLVRERGMIPVRSVTKSLDLLVASDVLSSSGKANKARRYNIPIWPEERLWSILAIQVESFN
jgi:DNA polymerase III subunit epsilon